MSEEVHVHILSLKEFHTKIYRAFDDIVSKIRKSDGMGIEYGGSFYVQLTFDVDEEQREYFKAYTWDELNQRFKEWCNDIIDEYDDIYLQKATLINPALTCYIKPNEKSGVVLALPYIKLMRIVPHPYIRNHLSADDFEY